MTSSPSRSAGQPMTRSGPRWPGGLLAAAGAVLAIEAILAFWPHSAEKDLLRNRAYSPHVLPSITESVLQWQVAHAANLRERQDLLLLGDSACLVGLDPRLLMRETGLKTWNVGTFGMVYTTGYADILELIIRRHGPPRFLVLHTSFYPLTRGLQDRAVATWLGRLRRWLAPPDVARYLLPSMRHGDEWRNNLFSFLKGGERYTGLDQPRGTWPSDNEIRRQLLENRGFLPDPTLGSFDGDMSWNRRFYADCVPGLHRIFELAHEHRFPVLFLLNPFPQQADTPETRRAVGRIERAMRKVTAPYPGVVLYEPFLNFYSNEECIDLRHVNQQGSGRLSGELSRWISLHWLPSS